MAYSLETLHIPPVSAECTRETNRLNALRISAEQMIVGIQPALLIREPLSIFEPTQPDEDGAPTFDRTFRMSDGSRTWWRYADPKRVAHNPNAIDGRWEEVVYVSWGNKPGRDSAEFRFIKNCLPMGIINTDNPSAPIESQVCVAQNANVTLETRRTSTDYLRATYGTIFGGWSITNVVNGAIPRDAADSPSEGGKVRLQGEGDYKPEERDIALLRAVGERFFAVLNSLKTPHA